MCGNSSPAIPLRTSGRTCGCIWRIHDRMAEWNDGDFLLCVKDGEVTCEPCADCEEDAVMVEMDIQTLTAMLMATNARAISMKTSASRWTIT